MKIPLWPKCRAKGGFRFLQLLLSEVVVAALADGFANLDISSTGWTPTASAIGHQPDDTQQRVANEPKNNNDGNANPASGVCRIVANLLA